MACVATTDRPSRRMATGCSSSIPTLAPGRPTTDFESCEPTGSILARCRCRSFPRQPRGLRTDGRSRSRLPRPRPSVRSSSSSTSTAATCGGRSGAPRIRHGPRAGGSPSFAIGRVARRRISTSSGPDGTGERRLTFRGGEAPGWSPHGSRLVFQRRVAPRGFGGAWQLFTLRSSGRGLRRLTRRGGQQPAWSPNGRRIAFVRTPPPFAEADPSDRRLCTARTSGGDVRCIARYSVAGPDWRPR